ncbi:MAG: bifunctional metallophosphatase/5'-nucleotidase [Calditrichaeota bacterium]|nr:MAG: bifunctional metallophosphatase/5'-nucleotidase [Calditrichota bacterium]
MNVGWAVWLLLIFCIRWGAAQESPPVLHLVYTANLNGALDDCRCGGEVVGGVTRILALVDSLRRKYPHFLLVDAGDFLSSYRFPAVHRAMLKLLTKARYQALNVGDQEFVEGTDFLVSAAEGRGLPLVAANLHWQTSPPAGIPPYRVWKSGGLRVAVLGVVATEAFDFIHPRDIRVNDIARTINRWYREITSATDLQILLFHGTPLQAEALIKATPWVDVVVVGHNQQRYARQVGNALMVETGTDGEYVGHVKIWATGNRWRMENEFIPITRSLPVDPEARSWVEAFYHSQTDR